MFEVSVEPLLSTRSLFSLLRVHSLFVMGQYWKSRGAKAPELSLTLLFPLHSCRISARSCMNDAARTPMVTFKVASWPPGLRGPNGLSSQWDPESGQAIQTDVYLLSSCMAYDFWT